MGEPETPELDDLTGYIAFELGETYKENKVDVEAYDALGEIDLTFPDGKKYRIEITEVDD